MKPHFESIVSALAYSIVREQCGIHVSGREIELNRVVEFVLGQRARMPDLLGLPMMILTMLFNLQALIFHGAAFNRLDHDHRWEHILAWRNSRIGARRDLIRFYESLSVLAWYSFREEED
jgi:hypothetical protein